MRSKSPDRGQEKKGATLLAEVPLPSTTLIAPQAPRTLKATEIDVREVGDIVKSLYDEHPHQCKSDGRRFKTKTELQQHLDRLVLSSLPLVCIYDV